MKSLNTRLRTACEEFSFNVLLDDDVRRNVGVSRCPALHSASDVTAVFREIAGLGEELLISAALDAQFRLVRWSVIATGTTIHSHDVRIIDAFHAAILSGARGIVLVQSHPFGRRRPSVADTDLTKRIAAAGKLLG